MYDEVVSKTREEWNEYLLDDGEVRSEKDYPWIIFSLDRTEYGVNSKYVLSIEILGAITPIVDAGHCCPGITRSRGDMIELLDLRALFGLGDYRRGKTDSWDERYMIVVIEAGGVKRGVIVDQVVSVEHVTHFEETTADAGKNVVSSRWVERIAKRDKLDSPLLIISPQCLNPR